MYFLALLVSYLLKMLRLLFYKTNLAFFLEKAKFVL